MVDWLFGGFMGILIAYMGFYIWALVFRIIPWLNISLIDVYSLTLLQVVATAFFFTGGAFLFVVCLIFVLGMVLG